MGGLYLVWLLNFGLTTRTAPPPSTSPLLSRRDRRLARRMLPRILSHSLPRRFRSPRRPRPLHLVTKIRRRPGGWLPALQLRLRLRHRADCLARQSLFMPSLSRTTASVHHRANYTSSAPWLLSSHYESDSTRSSIPDQPRVLRADGAYPIVIDTGASISVTPNAADFVNGISTSNLPELRGLNHTSKVAGTGLVEWTIFDVHNRVQKIQAWAFYVPDATIRLFSPQSYFQEQGGGELRCTRHETILTLANGESLVFPYNPNTNLPFMLPTAGRSDLEPTIQSDAGSRCGHQHTVGLDRSDADLFASPDELFELMSVADETNQNLTQSQKELLQWHWKLGHCNFQWVQSLAADSKLNDAKGEQKLPLLQTKNKISAIVPPLCAACQLAKQSRRGAGSSTEFKLEDRDMILKRDTTEPGDCVSIDQYVSTVLGRLPNTKGKEKKDEKYNGGTIFVDHATGYVHLTHQVSLRAGETVKAKTNFERFAMQHGVQIKRYRADNHPFKSQEFQKSLDSTRQTITFSGVGAKHQNGIAERTIQTISMWARAMLLHAVLHWPDAANLELWPFALAHAVYLWNHIPRKDIRKSPFELFTKSVMPSALYLQRQHVWGCPVYVLDPRLQDGKKIPKWDPRVRRGQFLGFSTQHSSTIGLILNHRTGSVTPQYHCVYDDLFTTVPNGEFAPVFDTEHFAADDWERLISSGGLERADIPTLDGNDTVFRLDDEWRAPADIERMREEEQQRRLERLADPEDLLGPPLVSLPREPPTLLRELDPQDDPFDLLDDGDLRDIFDPEVAPPVRDLAIDFQDEAAVEPRPRALSPPAGVRRSERVRKPNPKFKGDDWANYQSSRLSTQRVRSGLLNLQFLQSLNWSTVVDSLPEGSWKAMVHNILLHTDEEGLVDWLHPLALATKANNEDNPNWNQAMNGPNSDGFWKAMATEITTLVDKMDAWDVVDRQSWMNVLPSTWAFKCKRFPDGLIKKLKARFCVRGDKQLEGVDFFETFAPVVSWTTVRLMLILSLVLSLATRQVDYTAAFLHAPIDEDPDLESMSLEERKRTGVFVEMPRGFAEPGKVLKLKKSLYGLKQAPRNFFQHLKGKLEKIGFVSSEADPCLFISEKVICIVYVDDTLLFSPRPEYIDEVLSQLREEDLELEEEDDVAGFLGVNVERDSQSGEIRMTQAGLINRIIEALDCDSLPGKKTPAEYGALGTDKNGDPPQESFSYSSVIGMLQYLHTHTRPDLTLAVSQCSRFIHCTKRSHELALIRIGQYLKMTREKGLVLRPTSEMGIDCYVDADFAGLWNVEDPQDPTSVKSRTGYVLCIAGCPVIWASKLQSDIALSTMEAEYNALSTALKDLLPLKRLVQTVAKAVEIPLDPKILMRVTVWEDNTGALTLANLEPGRMTPRSKHYGVKYHWFREHLKPNNIQVLKIDTKDQQADMLTKALRTDKFELNRKQLMGWLSSTIWPDHLRSKGSVKILAKTARYLASPGIAWLRRKEDRYT